MPAYLSGGRPIQNLALGLLPITLVRSVKFFAHRRRVIPEEFGDDGFRDNINGHIHRRRVSFDGALVFFPDARVELDSAIRFWCHIISSKITKPNIMSIYFAIILHLLL